MSAAEPIKSKKDIELLKTVLKEKDIRYHLLFIVGINTGLRIGDILRLRVADFINDKGQLFKHLIIKEMKTQKIRRIAINTPIQKAVKSFLSHFKPQGNEFIFLGRKSKIRPITATQAYRVLNDTARACNLTIHIGTHTLRKTWSYWTYKSTGNNIGLVMEMLGHSSPAITLRYIGISQEQKDLTYLAVEL